MENSNPFYSHVTFHWFVSDQQIFSQDSDPISVSIVENECDHATNNIKVINNHENHPKKDDFVVCVRALDFDSDKSVRLIEWIENVLLFGASKIFFYALLVHPNMLKVIDHYVS